MHELANTAIMYRQGTADYRSLISLTSTTTAQTSVRESTIQIIRNVNLNGKMFVSVFGEKCHRYLESVKQIFNSFRTKTEFGSFKKKKEKNLSALIFQVIYDMRRSFEEASVSDVQRSLASETLTSDRSRTRSFSHHWAERMQIRRRN